MSQLSSHEMKITKTAEETCHTFLDKNGISLQLRNDFHTYLGRVARVVEI